MSSANLQTIIADWLNFLKSIKRYSPHTILAYQQDLTAFCSFATTHLNAPLTLKELENLPISTFRSWLAFRLQQQLTPRSTARALSALKSFYRYLKVTFGIENSVLRAIKSPRLQKTLPRPLNLEQTAQLLDDIETVAAKDWVGERDRALVILLYATGMRISEALSLRASILPLSDRLTITGKGGKQRVLPILPDVVSALESYVKLCPYPLVGNFPLFVGEKGKALNPNVVRRTLLLYRRAVGLPESVTPHALRHTCATHLMEGRHDLRSIQELLGHASLSSTQIYTNLDQQQLLKAYQQFHPRSKAKQGL